MIGHYALTDKKNSVQDTYLQIIITFERKPEWFIDKNASIIKDVFFRFILETCEKIYKFTSEVEDLVNQYNPEIEQYANVLKNRLTQNELQYKTFITFNDMAIVPRDISSKLYESIKLLIKNRAAMQHIFLRFLNDRITNIIQHQKEQEPIYQEELERNRQELLYKKEHADILNQERTSRQEAELRLADRLQREQKSRQEKQQAIQPMLPQAEQIIVQALELTTFLA